jgi:tetratricopeptide (TPR) repeat protein
VNAGYIPCRYCKPPLPEKSKEDINRTDKPVNGHTFFNKGYALSNAGNYAEAINAFSKGIEINPKDAGAYYNRGLAYAKTGRHEKAIETSTGQ